MHLHHAISATKFQKLGLWLHVSVNETLRPNRSDIPRLPVSYYTQVTDQFECFMCHSGAMITVKTYNADTNIFMPLIWNSH